MTIEQALKVLEYLDGYVEGDSVYWTEDKELAIRLAIETLKEKTKDWYGVYKNRKQHLDTTKHYT